jgi:16S rRNA (cytidine1402-2'-O)-methyltransferase
MGSLYLVSTPIGNLEDLSTRAKRILSQLAFLACEDTRRANFLLKKLSLKPPTLISYYEENELSRIPQILARLKKG